MASKDSESLEYEQLEQLKEKSKNREEQLIILVAERDKKIEKLEQKLNGMQSQLETTEKLLPCETSASNEPINKIKNDTMETIAKPINSTDSVLAELHRQLNEYRRKLKDKEDLLNNLKEKVEELDLQNFNLQEDNNKLSDEMMDYVYENELLTKKCEDYEEQMKSTVVPVKGFTTVANSAANNGFETKDTSMVLSQTQENMEYTKSIINEILDTHNESTLNGDYHLDNVKHDCASKTAKSMSEQLATEKNSLLQQISNFENLNSELKEQINKYEITKKDSMLRLEELTRNLLAADEKNLEYINIIEKLALSKTELEDQLNNARDRLADLETAKSDVTRANSESADRSETLQLEISMLKDQLSGLRLERKLFEEERNLFNQLEKELSEDVQEARSKLGELEKHKCEWESIILQSEEDIVKLKEQVTQLQDQLLRTQVEKEATDEKLVRIKEETKFAFESKIDDHMQVISSLEKKNAELCETVKDFEKVKAELEEQQALIESTKRQLDEKDSQLVQIRSELDSDDYEMLKVERDSLKQIKDDLSQQTVDLEQQVMTLKEEQNKVTNDMTRFTNAKDEHEKELMNLRKQLEKLIQSEQELQNSLTECKTSNQNLKVENKKLKELENNLEKKVKELNEANNVLVQDKTEALDENASLKEKIYNLNNTLESLEKFNADLKELDAKQLTEIQLLKELNINLEQQLDELNSDRGKSEQEYYEIKNECNALRLSLEDNKQHVQQLEKEYKDLKQSMNKTCDNLLELQQERDALLGIKQQHESEFQRKLMEECELTAAELTTVRSQNLVLNDKLETLSLEKEQMQVSLQQSAELALTLEKEVNKLRKKLERLEELEKYYAESKLENEKLNTCMKKYETEIKCHQKELELLAARHKEQFDEARVKLVQVKSELEAQIHQFNRIRKENDNLRKEINSKETENKMLLEKLELKNTDNKTAIREKEELLEQLHEMQKVYLFKIKQYEHQTSKLKSQIEQISHKKETSSSSPKHASHEPEKQIIKTLLGENNELMLKNQTLTAELHESREISQKNRKTKRYNNHDESRPLAWCDHHDVGTITTPTEYVDKSCNCGDLDKELTEAKKSLLIKDRQSNTLRMESKMNPFQNELETLKQSIEKDEAEKLEMRKELENLTLKMSDKGEEKSRDCDQCIRRSRTGLADQFTQTAEQPKTTLEDDHSKLQEKYEDLKRMCKLRNSRIATLQNQLSKKENEAANINTDNNSFNGAIKELTIVRSKYEEAKRLIGSRDTQIKSLEAELTKFKSQGLNALCAE